MTIFRCVGIHKWFGGVHALNDISLSLQPSTIVGIVGPNGAGKTTLFNVISGLDRPDRGSCFLSGEEVTGLPIDKLCKRGICRTFQATRIIGGESVLGNVLLGFPDQRGESLLGALFPRRTATERNLHHDDGLRLLELVGLEGKAKEPAAQLSYGEQKLLGLAACIATKPNIILLDEPFAGIQRGKASDISGLIKSLRSQGKSVALIEHDLQMVQEVVDYVVVLNHGSIVDEGRTADVFSRPGIVEVFIA